MKFWMRDRFVLDFLPVRCSGCHKVFCKDHYFFDCHSCPVGNAKERQVPVCPLCGVLVPIGPNESADVKVGHHIDTACKSQPALALKGKVGDTFVWETNTNLV